MHCTYCNHSNPEGVKFCEACGKPITGELVAVPVPPKTSYLFKFSGILTVIAGIMILVGFFLPWFYISFFGIDGKFSGFTGLIATFGWMFTVGLAAGSDYANNGGGLIFLALLLFCVFIALSPIMGISILRKGWHFVKSEEVIEKPEQKKSAKILIRLAIIGAIPLLCYLSIFTVQVSSFDLFGLLKVDSLSTGFWTTAFGFGLAILAGAIL